MTSKSRAIRSQSIKYRFYLIWEYAWFDRCSVSIYDIKLTAKLFDTIHDILRSVILAQSLLKGLNALIWRSWKREVKIYKDDKKSLLFLPNKFSSYKWVLFLNLFSAMYNPDNEPVEYEDIYIPMKRAIMQGKFEKYPWPGSFWTLWINNFIIMF